MRNEECCPEFHVEKWDKVDHSWENKHFIKESIPTFFHIPFPPMIGSKITKMWNRVQKSGAAMEDIEESLVLFYDPSPFQSEIYIAVNKEVPDAQNITLSGNFTSMVFDGPYNGIPVFIKEMDRYLESKGKKAQNYYVHYAYCPRCQKKFGHNYAALFAKTE